MQTFMLFGKYTVDAIGKISAERTTKLTDLVKKHGGEIRSLYALLGTPDLVLTLDLPGYKEATTLSLALTRVMGINFTTAAAITVDEFDKLAARA